MQNILKTGDKAVYPGYGVGKITSIENKSIMGSRQLFYSMEIMESGTKVMIPENRLKTVGVRPIASRKQAEKAMSILSENNLKERENEQSSLLNKKNWQKRQQSYIDKIKTGSIYEIAKVIRDLRQIREAKNLSYGEKKIMDKAKNILYMELSLTIDKKELSNLKQ